MLLACWFRLASLGVDGLDMQTRGHSGKLWGIRAATQTMRDDTDQQQVTGHRPQTAQHTHSCSSSWGGFDLGRTSRTKSSTMSTAQRLKHLAPGPTAKKKSDQHTVQQHPSPVQGPGLAAFPPAKRGGRGSPTNYDLVIFRAIALRERSY